MDFEVKRGQLPMRPVKFRWSCRGAGWVLVARMIGAIQSIEYGKHVDIVLYRNQLIRLSLEMHGDWPAKQLMESIILNHCIELWLKCTRTSMVCRLNTGPMISLNYSLNVCEFAEFNPLPWIGCCCHDMTWDWSYWDDQGNGKICGNCCRLSKLGNRRDFPLPLYIFHTHTHKWGDTKAHTAIQ